MRFTLILASVALAACQPIPPAPPAPRVAADVAASFGKTWEATIDQFASQNIQIKTLDRSSGLVVAEPQRGATTDYADCGTTGMQIPIVPEWATWNVLVRGDSARSTVKATVRFTSTRKDFFDNVIPIDCSSKGVWESQFETQIKEAAERPRP